MYSLFRNYLLLLLGLAGTCTAALAQKKETPIVIPDTLEHTLLWKLTGKGIKKPSYIYGTIHMISSKDYFLTEATQKAFAKTKKLVLEIDMSNQLGMAMEMMKLAPMKENKKLSDILPKEEYDIVRTYFEKESKSPELKLMPFSMVESWKPMLLQSFLYSDMVEKPVKAYEMEFVSMAKKVKNMTFGGLETVADQINVFETIPYEDQAKQLLEMVQDIKKGGDGGAAEFKKMVAMYIQQDVDGMLKTISSDTKEMKNGEDALLNDRNKKWIPLIIEMAKTQPTFFAVGAGHLGGDLGVIRLLMKEGYTLTPVK